MCYFLYGGINNDINQKDYEKIKNDNFYFQFGTQETIEKGINSKEYLYKLTNSCCDCDTAVGKQKYDSMELKELSEYIKSLKTVNNVKWIYICKKWWDDEIEDTKIVHIDDIDLIPFLADMKEKHLYKIELFQNTY